MIDKDEANRILRGVLDRLERLDKMDAQLAEVTAERDELLEANHQLRWQAGKETLREIFDEEVLKDTRLLRSRLESIEKRLDRLEEDT